MQPPEKPPKERTLIEERSFKLAMAALKLSYKTLDSIFENDIAMAICRKPETYPEVPYATGIRRLRIKKGINHPALNIWFEYDEETVTLIDVDRVGVDEKD